MAQKTSSASTFDSRSQGSVFTIEALAAMSVNELNTLYLNSPAPASLAALDGAPPGRMLTIAGPLGRGILAQYARQFSASAIFPWRGKRFNAFDEKRGTGINCIHVVTQWEWFPFTTSFQPSVMDGKPCVVLDYDQPENPWFIKRIHDELREVAPNLFLGPAMFKVGGRSFLVLFFGIDKTGW